ncbi:hypothetical protein [Kineococcus sp. SYSU DK005]|uniref:hypothetical protein n=1 Tax=Kineococcus sp. SYSU DK005 TaxID=3383126 RepID=UPI003D7DFBF9
MSQTHTGWHAFSPQDPDCPPHLRQLAGTSEPAVLGTVTITVHDLTAGASSVSVEGSGAGAGVSTGVSTRQLIDAAIAELHQARRLLTD